MARRKFLKISKLCHKKEKSFYFIQLRDRKKMIFTEIAFLGCELAKPTTAELMADLRVDAS